MISNIYSELIIFAIAFLLVFFLSPKIIISALFVYAGFLYGTVMITMIIGENIVSYFLRSSKDE